MMTVYSWLIPCYARAVYLYGTRRFVAQNGYPGVPEEYHEPVKQYAATNYSLSQIDNALLETYITEEEYNETIAYIPV